MQSTSDFHTRQYYQVPAGNVNQKSQREPEGKVTSVGQPPASGPAASLGSREADPSPSFKLLVQTLNHHPVFCRRWTEHIARFHIRRIAAMFTMASRRATATLAKACAPFSTTAAPARLRAAAQLSLRQHHTHTRPAQALCARRASSLLSSPTPKPRAAISRTYSTDAEAKPHKIWDFEAACAPRQDSRTFATAT